MFLQSLSIRRVLVMLVACAALVLAQGKNDKGNAATRTLEGQVVDAASKAVVGAVVQLKDTRTLEIRSFVTKEKGDYHFSGLRGDTEYEVKATFNGASTDTKKLSVFDNRQLATIDLRFK